MKGGRSVADGGVVSRALSIFLRIGALSMRFVFLLVLAKVAAPSVVGTFGLVVALTTYAVYGVGLDFYTFANRDLIASPIAHWGPRIRSQIALSCVLYLAFIPLLGVIHELGLLPLPVLAMVVPLIVVEHLSQEAFRLLLVMRRQTLASWILFLRVGAWCPAVVLLAVFSDGNETLYLALTSWIVTDAIAIILAGKAMRRMGLRIGRGGADMEWIRRGLRMALPFLVGTLAIRAISVMDRYVLNGVAGLDVVAAYVLFAGLGAMMSAAIDAGLLSFTYPEMMAAAARGDSVHLGQLVRRAQFATAAMTAILAVGALISATAFLKVLPDEYASNVDLLPWVIVGAAIQNVALVPHYALYSVGADRQVIFANVAGLATFLIVVTILTRTWDPRAVPVAVCAAFATILGAKGLLYARRAGFPDGRSSP